MSLHHKLWLEVPQRASDLEMTNVCLLYAGIQTNVMSMPGPVVAIAAHEHLLAIVWHAGPPFASCSQCLHFSLLDAADQSQVMSALAQ